MWRNDMTSKRFGCPGCGADLRKVGIAYHSSRIEFCEWRDSDVIPARGRRRKVWHVVDETENSGYTTCGECHAELPDGDEFEIEW
jgi:transcription elongation factor Elf1